MSTLKIQPRLWEPGNNQMSQDQTKLGFFFFVRPCGKKKQKPTVILTAGSEVNQQVMLPADVQAERSFEMRREGRRGAGELAKGIWPSRW